MARQVNNLVFVEQVQISLKIKSGGYHSQFFLEKLLYKLKSEDSI